MLAQHTYQDYLRLIGDRIKQYRINIGMSQHDLENASGVSTRSISRLEQGAPVQLENLIRILIALKLDDNINILIPDQTKRPSYYLAAGEKPRQRARRRIASAGTFKWGDEE